MKPLLAARRVLREQFTQLHRKVLLLARDNEVCRRGQQKTTARWLAVIMHRMWSDGTEFRWTREATPAAQ